jgi:putative ABC transport system permease protein
MTHHRDDDRLWGRIRRVFRLPFNRARLDAEIDEELRFHLEGRVDDLMASEGLTRQQAESEARRRFGDFAQYRREARDIDATTHRARDRMEIKDSIVREATRALRALRHTPGFTTVTILTLALGIGAATAIFTLLDAIVLRPLPYANAERLVSLSSPVPKLKGQTRWGLARHQQYYFLGQGRSLENLGVYNTYSVTLLGNGPDERPERVRWALTSASLFDVLGFAPHRGRLLTPEDNKLRRANVVVLGHAFWQRRYGGDNAIVGKTVSIEGFPHEVVGILPPRASLPDLAVDVWVPAWTDSTVRQNNHSWSAIARLKPGLTAADAERDLAPLTERLPEVFPDVYGNDWVKNTGFSTEVVPLRQSVVGDMVTRALWTLFGSVALVLLIAAANVANLFLVRIDARRRDVAISTALGAGRSHLAVQYLTESLLLTLSAGVLAILLAQGLLRLLLAIAPSELPRLGEVQLGGASVVFALAVTVTAGLVFGLLPLVSARPDMGMLREAGRGLTSSRHRMHARRLLIATQMAFAVVLLASAALMLRTFQNLRGVKPGFVTDGVLLADVALPGSRYGRDDALTSNFHDQLIARVAQLPGVRSVATSDRLPLEMSDMCNGINVTQSTTEVYRGACPPTARVTPGYFEAIGTRIIEGRAPSQASATEGGVVVSQAFAEHHWPGQSAIGKGVNRDGRESLWYPVVGVAEDVRGLGVTAPPVELVYLPVRPLEGARLWGPVTNPDLIVKTSGGDPLTLVSAIQRIAAELDPQVAIANARTMDAVMARSIAKQSFTMILLLLSAVIATLLSAVGIYGVISYIVAQRRGEIGVRLALGAGVGQVTTMVMRQSLAIAGVGVVVGVLAAMATTRFLRTLLFGVSPVDPVTIVAVPIVLISVAALATYLPARRASHVDPAEVLKS